MKIEELNTILIETGYPVAYSHFPKEVPSIPYVAFSCPESTNLFADNKVYLRAENIEIELCTKKKNPAQEKVLTDVLDSHELAWEKISEAYIEDDDVYSLIYQISEVIIYG